MFVVTVKNEKNYPDDKLKEVQNMYAETRNYGEICEYFDDFGLCDDAMLAWAIDLGWDVNSVLRETEEALANDLYSDENISCNFFYKIVNEAIGFIEEHLSTR